MEGGVQESKKRRNSMKNKLLLGVTASIAAYKACEIVREFKKKDIDVYVVMTKNATKLVTPLTFKTLSENPVFVEMFAENSFYAIPHINLSEICKTMLIAPATANIIGKIANGIADDLLSTLALSFKRNIFIAPAMNSAMYENPVVQENIKKLKKLEKVFIIEPEEGELACGESGKGRLADINKIVKIVLKDVLS